MTRSTRRQSNKDGTGGAWRRPRTTDIWPAILCRSVIGATAIHAGILLAWPWPQADVAPPDAVWREPLTGVSMALAAELPPPPPEIARPVLPEVGDIEMDVESLPLPELPNFDEAIPIELPEPPIEKVEDAWADYEAFSPRMVRPDIRNRREVTRFLELRYQPILSRTGAAGVVMLDFWIDETGKPQRTELVSSSGSRVLDDLALKLSRVIRFRPALREGKAVRVQVRVPIRFESTMRV